MTKQSSLAVAEQPKPKPRSLADLRQDREKLFQQFFDSVIQQVAEQGVLNERASEEISESLKGAIEKRDEVVDLLQVFEAEADRLKKMEEVIYDRRKEYEKFASCFRESIKLQMESLGLKRADGLVHRLLLREGKDSVEVMDITVLPPEFINWSPVADKSAISEALHAGREVPGAQLLPAKKSLVVS